MSDVDSDGDATPNCNDACPTDATKIVAGACGCGVSDLDSDGDATPNCNDACPTDATKIVAGACGCGVSDLDSDGDATPNCNDACPSDATKVAAGACGCGVSDLDSDADGTPDCHDECSADPNKTSTGACGCGSSDVDSDYDGVADCHDVCPGFLDTLDEDADGTPDGCDVPVSCTSSTFGVHTHQGDVFLESTADIAALHDINCINGTLFIGPALTSLIGLEALTGISGSLDIADNAQLQALDGLDGLVKIEGELRIRGNLRLSDLVGLGSLQRVDGRVEITGNIALDGVDGLEHLTDIGNGLRVADNAVLSNLAGLSGLVHIDRRLPADFTLVIENNPRLPQCWTWSVQQQAGVSCASGSNFTSCGGNTGTGTCGALPAGFACVEGARGPGVYDGSVTIYSAEQLAALSGAACITGGLYLNYVPATDLSALSNLRSVGGILMIVASSTLTSLNGLQNLREVGVSVEITSNFELTSLDALSGLTSVGAHNSNFGAQKLAITNNPKLPACSTWQLARQVGLSCTTGGARCEGNHGHSSCGALPPDFACVPGATGPGVYDGSISLGGWNQNAMTPDDFGGLTCVTGWLEIDGGPRIDLSVLSSLQFVGGTLSIRSNPDLVEVAGLEALVSVGERLFITDNPLLASLAPLANLVSLGSRLQSTPEMDPLWIANNAGLAECWVTEIEQQTGRVCRKSQGPGLFSNCQGNQGAGTCEN